MKKGKKGKKGQKGQKGEGKRVSRFLPSLSRALLRALSLMLHRNSPATPYPRPVLRDRAPIRMWSTS